MTLSEAQIIANIIGTADNGCSTCVSNLVDRFNAANLEFNFNLTFEDRYIKDEDGELIRDGLIVSIERR